MRVKDGERRVETQDREKRRLARGREGGRTGRTEGKEDGRGRWKRAALMNLQ